MANGVGYSYEYFRAEDAASSDAVANAISYVFSNSFGTNPKTGRPYRLGPKTTHKRLVTTTDVVLAYRQSSVIGYSYARILNSIGGKVLWIDSLAVLPDHRNKTVGTEIVTRLIEKAERPRWIGCATPNPVAAYVITRAAGGRAYIGDCGAPQDVINMIEQIRSKCPDLSGADFNPTRLLVKTTFTPVRTDDTTVWTPPHHTEPPPWWASLGNLPAECEAILVIDTIL